MYETPDALWISIVGIKGIGQMAAPPVGARELLQETFGMMSYG